MDKYCSGCDSWKSPAHFNAGRTLCQECSRAADRKRYADKKAGTYAPKPRGPRGPYLTGARRAEREAEELAIGLEDARRAIAALCELQSTNSDGVDVLDFEQVHHIIAGIPAPSHDVLTAQCDSCGRTRVFDDFSRDSRAVSGRSRTCHDCAREQREQAPQFNFSF